MKAYFSPSDQVSNTYIVGNTNEAEQCREICQLAVKAAERCGIDAKTNVTGSMAERVADSNAWGADLHVPVHTNGADGKADGTLLMCYDLIGKGFKASQAILKALGPLSPGSDYAIWARPSLYEIRASNAPCAYVEAAFHDNPIEAQWIIDHKAEIAEAIVQGVCEYFGVLYVPPVEEKERRFMVQSNPVDQATAEKLLQLQLDMKLNPTLLEVII